MLSVGGSAKGVITKSQQRSLIMVGFEPDVATATTVAPIGTALCHVSFASKTDASGAAIASFGVQLSAVDEG